MRLNPANFEAHLQARQSEPRYVVSIAFAANDVVYFTSHQDCALPAGAVAITSVVKRPSGITQRLRAVDYHSEIGEISLDLVDRGNQVTEAIKDKLAAGRGLKGKQVRIYCGYKGLAWGDYQVVATQIIRKASYHNSRYHIGCADIQRALREKVFATAETTLAATISATDTTITVAPNGTTGFYMVAHGNSYSDAPNQTVGYVLIESEIIRYTGKTANTLTGCTRGALNTLATGHVVNQNSGDRPIAVKEHVFLELPAPKLALALMTGELYGQSGATLPTSWHLGIDAQWIRKYEFADIGADWWNPANDAEGVTVRFEGLSSQDGQRFIEQQLLLLLGAYPIIYSDGTLGIKRATRVMRGASAVATLGVRDVVEYSELEHDLESVINWIEINWNYDALKKRTTRTTTLLDPDSIGKHGMGQRKVVQLLGLHGSRHSESVLRAQFNSLRDRFAGPPQRMRIKVLHKWSSLEVGDIIRVQLPGVMDWVTGQTLDRSFEIQSVQTDWITGEVWLDLFGSTERASLSLPTTTTVLPDSAYSALGQNLATVLPITVTGGVGHIIANATLAGAASTVGGAGRYYYLGDLTLDAGVVLTITQNVQLWVMGHLTINGQINGVGQGLAGGAGATTASPGAGQGQAGYFGITTSQGTSYVYTSFVSPARPTIRGDTRVQAAYPNSQGGRVTGAVSVAPVVDSYWTGAVLTNVPTDLRGSSGSGGGVVYNNSTAAVLGYGGAGGAGGAGLALVLRGVSFGANGNIKLDGAAGVAGQGPYTCQAGTPEEYQVYAGAGAGGMPGVLWMLIDGNAQYPGITSQTVSIKAGVTPTQGNVAPTAYGAFDPLSVGSPVSGGFWQSGNNGGADYLEKDGGAALRISYIRGNEVATPDINIEVVQPPLDLFLESHEPHLLTNQDGTQTPRLYFQFAASPDPYLSGYHLQYRLQENSRWISVSALLSVDELDHRVAGFKEGQVVYGRVRAVNKWNKASVWVTYGPHTIIGKTSNPSNVVSLTATLLDDGVQLSWPAVTDLDLLEYDLREGSVWETSTTLARVRATAYKVPPQAAGNRQWSIKAIDTGGRTSVVARVGTLSVAAPAAVTVGYAITGASVDLSWNAPASDFAIASYEVRRGASWAAGTFVTDVTALSHRGSIDWSGARTYWVAAIDVAGNVGAAGSVVVTVAAPSAPTVNHVIDGADAVLSWVQPSATLPLAEYEVRHGADWASGTYVTRLTGLSLRAPVTWGGSRAYWIAAVDVNGNVGAAGSVVVTITAPSAVPMAAEVIDNNVLLRLSDVTATLPVVEYEIRRGATWAGGTVLGTVSARFFVRFEGAAGVYTYWAAAIDSAGNYGAPGQITATVSQPPDYVLLTNVNSTFSGALNNMVQDTDGTYVLPVNTTETFEQHFQSHGWATPNDQVTAGYSLFAQPSAASGYYEEAFDYGTVIAATKITLTVGGQVISGSPAISVTLSISSNGSAWTDYADVTELYATNFRYVKFRVTVTSSGGDDLYRIATINLTLDAKLKNDAGMASCNAGDSGGTQVNFNVAFVDVTSITVTPQGTTPVVAVFDFVDAPNPTGFKILLFNQSGNRVSGSASWSVKGF